MYNLFFLVYHQGAYYLCCVIPQIILLVILIGVIVLLQNVFFTQKTSKHSVDYPYQPIEKLFTAAETKFFYALDAVVHPQEYKIFGKVRLADIIRVKRGMEKADYHKAFNRIKSKHIDYVLCNASTLSIELLIELDDASHQKPERQRRDSFLDAAAKAAGVRLLHVPWQKHYAPEILSKSIQEALGK